MATSDSLIPYGPRNKSPWEIVDLHLLSGQPVPDEIASQVERPWLIGEGQELDLGLFGNFINTWSIWVENLQVKNLQTLAKVSKLKNLSINTFECDLAVRSSAAKEIEKLGDLQGITGLHLIGVPITDLTPIRNLLKVETMVLEFTDIKNLQPLEKLENMWSLLLKGSKQVDISSLAKFPNLKRLDISQTEVSDLSPLKNHPNLREINASETLVKDWSPVNYLEDVIGRPSDWDRG